MAIRGRKPKPDSEKVTRHALGHEWIDVPDTPYPGRPLGKHPVPGEMWAPGTREWWRSVSTMPHCVLWGAAQWMYAKDTAVVYDRWLKGDRARAGELRNRARQLGTTMDSLRDLRIRYVNPKAFEAPPVAEKAAEDGGEPTADRVADFEAERRRRLLDG